MGFRVYSPLKTHMVRGLKSISPVKWEKIGNKTAENGSGWTCVYTVAFQGEVGWGKDLRINSNPATSLF
jgi:hypothetical protein